MKVNPKIFGAFLVGGSLIGLAYFFAPTKTETPSIDATTGVVAGVAPERHYITVEDSDNDGIPDWSENFRYAEPVEISEEDTQVSDYTPPETLTGQLAIDLLKDSIHAEGQGALGPSQETILNSATAQLEEAAVDALYSERELSILNDTSIPALREYGNSVAAIAINEELPADTRPAIEILQHAARVQDATILTELDPIITAYQNLRNKMLVLSVPKSVAREHLNLLNTYNAVLIDIEGMQQALDDPLYTMVRMKRYYDDTLGLNNAVVELYTALHNQGVRWSEDDIASQIINVQ